jgi:phosphatidylserine/phosphatidylglycerophosphate/cardiolipin synthase-like enzyme
MRNLLSLGGGAVIGLFLGLLMAPHPSVTPLFSPEGGHDVISFIDGATSSLDMEMYLLTSRDVIEALERAKSRGVAVRIILEKGVMDGENGAAFEKLSSEGFRIRYAGGAYKLTHSKFMVADGKTVLVGSHNMSGSALFENREASVIIGDASTAGEFERVFGKDWALAA